MAEKEGFEPSRPFRGLHDFQSCALDQLGDFSIVVDCFYRYSYSVPQRRTVVIIPELFPKSSLFSNFLRRARFHGGFLIVLPRFSERPILPEDASQKCWPPESRGRTEPVPYVCSSLQNASADIPLRTMGLANFPPSAILVLSERRAFHAPHRRPGRVAPAGAV